MPTAGGREPEEAVPQWVPVEPLPSSEMVLSAFAGRALAAAVDILDPVAELVLCQQRYRVAMELLADPAAGGEAVKAAAAEMMSAHTDIEILMNVIDEAVADRLLERENRTTPVSLGIPITGSPDRLVHTESVGEIVTRMAALWEVVIARASDPDELPEAHQLCELSVAYDQLAAEIESGHRIPPGL